MSHSNFARITKSTDAANRHWAELQARPKATAITEPTSGSQTAAARVFADQLRTLRESKDQVAAAEAMKQTLLAMRNGATPEPSMDKTLTEDQRLCALMDTECGPVNSGIMSSRSVGDRRPAQSGVPMTDAEMAAEMARVFG